MMLPGVLLGDLARDHACYALLGEGMHSGQVEVDREEAYHQDGGQIVQNDTRLEPACGAATHSEPHDEAGDRQNPEAHELTEIVELLARVITALLGKVSSPPRPVEAGRGTPQPFQVVLRPGDNQAHVPACALVAEDRVVDHHENQADGRRPMEQPGHGPRLPDDETCNGEGNDDSGRSQDTEEQGVDPVGPLLRYAETP